MLAAARALFIILRWLECPRSNLSEDAIDANENQEFIEWLTKTNLLIYYFRALVDGGYTYDPLERYSPCSTQISPFCGEKRSYRENKIGTCVYIVYR
jgi:hypothetical protein